MPTTTTHFDCFFDEQEARAYVQESGNAHPCEDGLLALSGDGNVVKETRFQARDYLNAGSVDGVLATIDTIGQIGRFADRCPELRDYTIDVVLPGSAGEMQIAPNTDVLYVGAKLDPQFFDAQLCNARALTCYSKTTALRGFVHSGDLTAAGHFVHTIKVTASPEPGVYVVSAVGYNHNPIHRYQKVNPFVILVDHQRRVLKVFYFSMEKSLIGESMLIAPLRFRLCADRTLRWFAPRVCDVDGRVNTGDYTAAFQARVAAATREFDRDWNAAVAEASAPIPLPTTPAAPSSTPSLAAATFGGRRIVLVQDGVDGRALVPKDGTLLHFGTTLALADAPPQVKPRPEVLLPIAAGVAHGHSSLALGTPANLGGACTSREAYHAWLEAADALVLHADNSSAWTEPVMQAVCARLNGFLVVHVAESLPLDASARARVLGELTLCCVRMMGTASLVFVHDGAALYLYRGPTDLFPPPLCGLRFADPVPLAPHQLADIDTPKPLGRVVPFDDQRVFVDGRLEAARDVELVARVVRRAVGWETLSAQLSVALSPAEVRRVKDEAQGLILADEKAATRELQAAVQEAIDDFTARLEDAPASSELSLYMADARAKILVAKKALSSAQAEYREALGRVEQLCSLRLISKRTVGVQQATRARTIAENVGEAVSMTEEDMSRELEDNCWGLAVARVDSMQIEAFLQAISQKKIDAYLQRIGDHEELAVPPPFRIAPNCIQIDVSTAEILLMHGGNADHALASDGKQLTFTMQGEAHLVMPLFTRANDVMNGEYVNYMEECQSKPVAHYRVILRNMLSALKSRISISPQAVDLTLGIQLMPLFLMLSITRDVRDLGALQPTDTKCQILRSLFYLWGTFAGSGKKPSTFAYQLTQPGAVVVVPKQRGEYTIYAMVAHIYPYLRLPLQFFESNVRALLVEIIWAANEKRARAPNRIPRVDNHDRNEALRWNWCALRLLQMLDGHAIEQASAQSAADKLLARAPRVPTYTTLKLRMTLTLLRDDPTAVDWPLTRLVIASAIIKRSGIFAAVKRERCIAALRARKSELGIERPVQNESAYAAGDDAKMRGDAELTRIAFRVDGRPLPDHLTNEDFLRDILRHTDVSEATRAALIVAVDRHMETVLAPQTHELWQNGLSLASLTKVAPRACLLILFKAIGVDEDRVDAAIAHVTRMMLVAGTLPTERKQAGVAYLHELGRLYGLGVDADAPVAAS